MRLTRVSPKVVTARIETVAAGVTGTSGGVVGRQWSQRKWREPTAKEAGRVQRELIADITGETDWNGAMPANRAAKAMEVVNLIEMDRGNWNPVINSIAFDRTAAAERHCELVEIGAKLSINQADGLRELIEFQREGKR